MSSSLEGRIDIRLTRNGDVVTNVEIRSSRPQLAQKLMAGRGPEEAADLAGLIFSLCGKAQRVAAQAACEAARGLTPGRDARRTRERNVLVELAQEHAWRLLLDWPEQAGSALKLSPRNLSPDMPSLLVLRQNAEDPLRFAEALENLLEAKLLGESLSLWLGRDSAGFDAWRCDARTLVASLFADLGEGPDPGIGRTPFLPPLASLDSVLAADLARRALDDAAYCAAPLWQGQPAETGALARVSNHPMLAGWIVRRGCGAGARLLARLLELAELPRRLCADTGPADGLGVVRGWRLEEDVGMAGVETSRGLLIHVVRLRHERVADYRIVAPTEWNFHPAGPLVRALTGLPAGPELESRARLVSQSLDPCVAYGVELNDA